jgi:hypothetical protein
LAKKLDTLCPGDWTRPFDLGGDVVGDGIDFISLQGGLGTNGFQIAKIFGGHVVAALVGVSETVEVGHRRSWPSALYGLASLISFRRPLRAAWLWLKQTT